MIKLTPKKNLLTVSKQQKFVVPVKKKKVLYWGDSVLCTTGFGIVSKYLLAALHATGRYEIDQLAINYFGEVWDRNEYPYQIIPAKLRDPNDPYGNAMLLDILRSKDYDYLFIMNDTFVTQSIASHIKEIRQEKKAKGHPFLTVYYYPVDCCVRDSYSAMLEVADITVAYSKFAAEETFRVLGEPPSLVIPLGTDPTLFRPLPSKERDFIRSAMFKINDPDRFIWINVNRNSPRKDVARTIYAFKEFQKLVPNSFLYLHMAAVDKGAGSMQEIDLAVPCRELGLRPGIDVAFPAKFNVAKGLPAETLNKIYNASDAFITTSLGEGWGMSAPEAMGTLTPVVAPNNSVFPEIMGANQERGYMYKCKEPAYVDASGYRHCGRIEDIVNSMLQCYNETRSGENAGKIAEARKFIEDLSWQAVGKQWQELFTQLDEVEPGNNVLAEVL